MVPLLARFAAPLLVAAALLLLQAEAQAHAALVQSEPADGAVLAERPQILRLVFSEPVSPVVMHLVGPTGRSMRLKKFHLHDMTLAIEPPADLTSGPYLLSWRVTSADGHPIGGTVTFSIGAAGHAVPAGTASGSGSLPPFIWLSRVAFYLGLFLGVGALAFHAFIAPAPELARRFSAAALWLGLSAVVPSAAFQGLDLMGEGPRGLSDPESWSAALSSSYMLTLIVGAAAMAAALAGWRLPPGSTLGVLSAAALCAVGAALAASGHASAASPQWLTRPAVVLHGVGIAAWTGSLVPLMLTLGGGGEGARQVLDRFSRVILPFVAILTAAGVALAVVQVGGPSALWTTAYGRVFLAKLGLLALLFTLAAINRFILTPAYRRREPASSRQFVRSVRLEIALVCAILAVAALWRFTPPPRTLAAVAAAPASVHIHAGNAMVELSVMPGRAGPVRASIHVMGADLAPLEPQEVTLALSNPDAGVEPVRRSAVRAGPGSWEVEGLVVLPRGKWSVRIDLLISDFEKRTLEGTLELR